jgi:hypothetical protein
MAAELQEFELERAHPGVAATASRTAANCQ